MEKILHTLFEYQKFEKNERLSAMLEQAQKTAKMPLNDEELAWVAGGVGMGEDADPSDPE